MFSIEDWKPAAQEQGYRTSSCSTSCAHWFGSKTLEGRKKICFRCTPFLLSFGERSAYISIKRRRRSGIGPESNFARGAEAYHQRQVLMAIIQFDVPRGEMYIVHEEWHRLCLRFHVKEQAHHRACLILKGISRVLFAAIILSSAHTQISPTI